MSASTPTTTPDVLAEYAQLGEDVRHVERVRAQVASEYDALRREAAQLAAEKTTRIRQNPREAVDVSDLDARIAEIETLRKPSSALVQRVKALDSELAGMRARGLAWLDEHRAELFDAAVEQSEVDAEELAALADHIDKFLRVRARTVSVWGIATTNLQPPELTASPHGLSAYLPGKALLDAVRLDQLPPTWSMNLRDYVEPTVILEALSAHLKQSRSLPQFIVNGPQGQAGEYIEVHTGTLRDAQPDEDLSIYRAQRIGRYWVAPAWRAVDDEQETR